MLHLEALKRLKVTSAQLEVVASMVSGASPQVRLSRMSEPLLNGKRVAGEILAYSASPHSLFRMFRSGLFEATIGLASSDFDRLWQACSMPYEHFNASLALRNEVALDWEMQEVDLILTYEIGRGTKAWEGLPSEDWIR